MNIEREFLTPPELGKELGTGSDKVLIWIQTGELEASNLATNPKGRPRWRISREAVKRFLQSRAATPPPPTTSHRKRLASGQVTEFF